MTTSSQCREFLAEVIVDSLDQSILDGAIEWVKTNLEPGDVFEEDELTHWVKGRKGRLDAVPEDLFDDSDLEDWAEENGWVREVKSDG